jgi:SAM-dependent methyltransferase
MTPAWFESWFDTPWYHLLYRHRDEREAFAFIDRLVGWLSPEGQERVLDLACGRGRHARRLAEHGLDVTGIDLSRANIRAARAYEAPGLAFFEHDMRRPFRSNYFDWTLNLFTSFGYFERESDNLRTLDAVCRGLRPNGRFVLDFLNVDWVLEHLVPEETRTVDDLTFHIRRFLRDGRIVKEIRFEAEGVKRTYEEQVQALTREDFERYFESVGLRLEARFGNYALEPAAPDQPRLILVARKPGGAR